MNHSLKTDCIINVDNLTKDFGDNKGIFNLSFTIKQGEMVGFVGTNGSGKSTTIRSIVGFIKPTSGEVQVFGLDSWKYSSKFIRNIGYVPGEIGFPDLPTGSDFLKSQAKFLKLKDLSYANNLIKRLQLDPRANLKRMSKGMKQKTAIIAALMNNPDVLVLDEPTTGLDPLMRINFIDLIKEEHNRGKTIFMSSQSFEELEETCDQVIFILDGKIIAIADMNEIRNRKERDYKIEFNNKSDYNEFNNLNYKVIRKQEIYNQVTVEIGKGKINTLMEDLKQYDLKFISENKYTLEGHFKHVARKVIKEE